MKYTRVVIIRIECVGSMKGKQNLSGNNSSVNAKRDVISTETLK